MSTTTTTVSTSPEQSIREQELVELVRRSFAATADERLRTLMSSLVSHLHGFITDTRLTEEEWTAAISFLTEVGDVTDERRQEFILLSDVLGASMQVVSINNQAHGAATEATVFGPFFVAEAPLIDQGGDIAGTAGGQPCWMEGTVRDVAGAPITDARIEIWQADEDGLYDVQYDDGRVAGRAHLFNGADGAFRFWAVTPTPYPIPSDGPVGRLLAAAGRSAMRASHLHFMVTAPEFRTLVTHVFVSGCAYLEHDSVFGVKDSLVIDFDEQPPDTPTPDGREISSWARARFDIVLAPRTTP